MLICIVAAASNSAQDDLNRGFTVLVHHKVLGFSAYSIAQSGLRTTKRFIKSSSASVALHMIASACKVKNEMRIIVTNVRSVPTMWYWSSTSCRLLASAVAIDAKVRNGRTLFCFPLKRICTKCDFCRSAACAFVSMWTKLKGVSTDFQPNSLFRTVFCQMSDVRRAGSSKTASGC